ncbi:MAG: hypothetical protein CFE45_31090, partial [Burkholderiales bacterium PBB5]
MPWVTTGRRPSTPPGPTPWRACSASPRRPDPTLQTAPAAQPSHPSLALAAGLMVVGVGVALAGGLIFLSDKLLGGHWAATGGDLLMLFAASLFSYYTVMSKPLIQRHGGVAVMAYATLAGSPLLVLGFLPTALAAPWGNMAWHHWALMLWASLVSAFLGWLVWGWVNEQRGVARTAPLQYLMPLVAGAVAWWVTGERFSSLKIAGAG